MKKENTGIHSVYIGNLSYNCDENHILGLFKTFGYIKSIKIMREGKLNKSKGFAFVDMVVLAEAQKAIAALDGKSYSGRVLKASLANTQNFKEENLSERPPRPAPSKTSLENKVKKERRLRKKTGLQALFDSRK